MARACYQARMRSDEDGRARAVEAEDGLKQAPADPSAPAARAVSLSMVLLPCLLSFAAWEVARLWVLPGPEAGAGLTLVASGVRAILLLAPAALVIRLVFDEPLGEGFWLRAPAREGLLQSIAIGLAYLGLVNGLGAALGQPITFAPVTAVSLFLLVFDASVEEALFRGFLLSHVMRSFVRSAWANAFTAAIFVVPHTRLLLRVWSAEPLQVVPVALSLFVLGLALGATARPVRSIAVACVVHAVNNYFATL